MEAKNKSFDGGVVVVLVVVVFALEPAEAKETRAEPVRVVGVDVVGALVASDDAEQLYLRSNSWSLMKPHWASNFLMRSKLNV